MPVPLYLEPLLLDELAHQRRLIAHAALPQRLAVLGQAQALEAQTERLHPGIDPTQPPQAQLDQNGIMEAEVGRA